MTDEMEPRRRRPPEQHIQLELSSAYTELLVVLLATVCVSENGETVESHCCDWRDFSPEEMTMLRILWDQLREKLGRSDVEWPETEEVIPQWFARMRLKA